MSYNDKLTKEELEDLAAAYLDCRLSRLQEKELELVLTTLYPDVSSPIIDEARQTMEATTLIETASDKCQPRPDQKRHKGRIARLALRWSGIAALVALIAGSMFLSHRLRHDSDSFLADEKVYVIVDGEVITGERAKLIASEAIAASFAETASEIREITEMQQRDKEFKESIINEVNNYL